MTVELFQDTAGNWRWHLKADNGEILASSEAYASKASAERTARMVQTSIDSPVPLDD